MPPGCVPPSRCLPRKHPHNNTGLTTLLCGYTVPYYMAAKRYALDWDGTCVDENGEWIDGAVAAIRKLRKTGVVIIHSSKASWDGGHALITMKLRDTGLKLDKTLQITAKPRADVYLDNQAIRFTGSWVEAMRQIKELE